MDTIRIITKFLTFILLLILCCEYVCLGADQIICKENERKALLSFKQGLIDYDGGLSSWGSQADKKECCNWLGVGCGNGHVFLLDLQRYKFSGEIRPSLAELHHLNYLDLSYNHFQGNEIPEFIGSFKKLEYLNLAASNLSGDVPYQLGNLANLRRLDLSLNSLQGTISEVHLSKLRNLKYLDLSFNSLTLNLTPEWVPLFQLEEIKLARCNMGPRFPVWLRTQTKFHHLDLSSTGISSQVPNWLWSHTHGISWLDLSANQFSGSIPMSSNILFQNLSSNNFSGHVPSFHPNSYVIELSGNMFTGLIQSLCRVTYENLQILDMSKNQLFGDIPDCWQHMSYLQILNLGDNKFHGHIPQSLGSLHDLEILNLRNNNLNGELSFRLKNLKSLNLIDVGGNKLTGNLSKWLGDLTNVYVFSLRRNNFYGSIPLEICSLSKIQVLDLSHNSLSGTIPQCVNNWTDLRKINEDPARYENRFTMYESDTTKFTYVYDANSSMEKT